MSDPFGYTAVGRSQIYMITLPSAEVKYTFYIITNLIHSVNGGAGEQCIWG